MKNKIALFFLFTVIAVNAQKISAVKLNSEVLSADVHLGTDKFGFRYGIRDNVFFKFQNNQFVEYKNLSLGKITKVDLHNPLKIILFYENFNTIVTLDNQLNETQRVNFSDNAVPLVVSATGMSSRNRFWIYDSLSMKIGLFDYLTNKYSPLTQPLQGNIRFYDTDFNHFQWIDNHNNWYACDVFGKISSMGIVPEFDQIQIVNPQWILFSKDGGLRFRDFKNGTEYTVENVEKSFKGFSYSEQILSIFTTEGITNYKIILP